MKLSRTLIAAAAGLALAAAALPASAVTVYTLDTSDPAANLGSGPYGTVSLTQNGANVDFNITLASGYNFVSTGGPHDVFAFNATGVALEIKSRESEEGTVLLTQFNPERLAPDLFAIPPGFVAYPSVEAMVREVLRKPRIMPYSNGSTSRRNRH